MTTNIDFVNLRNVLYTSVLSDVLDDHSYRNQAMRSFIRPLDEAKVLFGRARTGLYTVVYDAPESENPYDVEIALVDDLEVDDISVFACNGPTERIAPWGELLSTASMMRGAVGCITDGLVRDVRQIRELGFPVFHGGIGPIDSKGRGKMIARDVVIECAGVTVNSGDLIFGDVDGVVVIPRNVITQIIKAALVKIKSENNTRDALKRGLLLSEVYEKYGVL
jgi:4-hydroxy-4-methyl-2-oxoglutarate aldolase